MRDGLTPKQKKFVQEYLKDLNATQAALRAGYSKKTSYSIGQENLKKPEIQDVIAKHQNKLAKKAEVTREQLVDWYLTLIRRGLGTVEIDDDGNQTAYRFDLSGTAKVLDQLAKLLGLNEPEKKELTAIFLAPEQRRELLSELESARQEQRRVITVQTD